MANNRYKRRNKTSKQKDRPDVRRNAREDITQGNRGRRDDYDSHEARNDVSWYSRYPNLLVAAGSFPYPYRPGSQLQLGSANIGTVASPVDCARKLTIPGVMSLSWIPSVGTSNVATDPISVAAKEIYAKVRSVYSGSLDADAPDFIMYIMALDSIYSYIAYLKRIYRTLNLWSPDNYALPDVLLASMMIPQQNAVQMRSDRIRLWQVINDLVLQTRKFTCPALMDVFNRHYWMSDNVYTDAPTINSQFYVFCLQAVLKYAPVAIPGDSSGNTAAGLTCVEVPHSSLATIDNYYQFGLDLINALVAWDDAYTINGYLKRAYEGTPNFMVSELAMDEVLTPVYEPEVLAQIENSRTIPGGEAISGIASGFGVAQNPITNAVISNPQYECLDSTFNELRGRGYTLPQMLSARSDTPTVADNVIASRLKASVEIISETPNGSSGAEHNKYKYVISVRAGTEIPVVWRLWTVPYDAGDHKTWGLYVPTTPVSLISSPINLTAMLSIEQFDWHPFVFALLPLTTSATTAANFSITVLGDTHNLTYISQTDLENLHKVCLYSEFNAFNA